MTEGKNIKEQINKLVSIKDIDAEIFDVESQLEIFPERIKEIEASLEAKKAGMDRAGEELKQAQLSKNEKELDLKEKEERVAKHESELYQIKNNKEYAALQQEIDSFKADVSLLEEAIIGSLDKIAEAEEACEREKKVFETEKETSEKEKSAIKEDDKKLSDDLVKLKSARDEIAATLDPDILACYEKILENKGRVALSVISGSSCSECNLQLRAQIINEAKIKKSLVFCENCSRILYAEE